MQSFTEKESVDISHDQIQDLNTSALKKSGNLIQIFITNERSEDDHMAQGAEKFLDDDEKNTTAT